MSEIRRYTIYAIKEKPSEWAQPDGEWVKYTDHLAAIEALKASYEAVPVSMREHADAIVKELNDSMNPDGVTNSIMIRIIESYLNERFIGIAEKGDAKTKP